MDSLDALGQSAYRNNTKYFEPNAAVMRWILLTVYGIKMRVLAHRFSYVGMDLSCKRAIKRAVRKTS